MHDPVRRIRHDVADSVAVMVFSFAASAGTVLVIAVGLHLMAAHG